MWRNWLPSEQLVTDTDGKYDFGAVATDHYILRIKDVSEPLKADFIVEITGLPESAVIDIAPAHPDCRALNHNKSRRGYTGK